MKIVILAAGLGERLGEENKPKCLTLLANGKTILEHQLDNLTSYIPLDTVYIVVGYHKELILDKLPNLIYIYNPDFAKENTAKSLMRALSKIDDDVIWINGDVVFSKYLLDSLFTSKKSAMIVNNAKTGEEEIKYRLNEKGNIAAVSKQLTDGQGEAVGINLILKRDLPYLKENLRRCEPNDYFEKAIEMCIEQGVDFSAIVVEENSCTEIDFPDDLKKANTLLPTWKRN